MKKGFTLVELAIVLVIVGLLVAGILSGQSLIHQAQIRNVLAQFREYDTAVLTFKTKYGPNALPGDFDKASDFSLNIGQDGNPNVADTQLSNDNGDGDGILEYEFTSPPQPDGFAPKFSSELVNFWVHLSNSGLIKESFVAEPADCNGTQCSPIAGVSFPSARIGTGIVALTESQNKVFYILGTFDNITLLASEDGEEGEAEGAIGDNLAPEEAYAIDSKLDDGKPDTGGSVVIEALADADSGTESVIDTTLAADDCFSVAGGDYNLSVTTKVCTITVKASF